MLLCAASLLAACVANPGQPEGDVARGENSVTVGQCRSCHGADLAGSPDPIGDSTVYSSNITPDEETGIGLRSDEDLDALMRLGKSVRGDEICAPMPVYDSMSAQESADIIAYLRSVPPVHREVAVSMCP
jgi:mono/diheme cytochrome c family protein